MPIAAASPNQNELVLSLWSSSAVNIHNIRNGDGREI